MPISAEMLAELGIEPATPYLERKHLATDDYDARGYHKSHPDYDPFEWSTPEEIAEKNRQMEAIDKSKERYRKGLGVSIHAQNTNPDAKIPYEIADARETIVPNPKFKKKEKPASTGKKKPADHNARTKKYFNDLGYAYFRADYFDARLNISHDLMGVFDALIVGNGHIGGVQLTSTGNISARQKKIEGWKYLSNWKENGGKVFVIGWSKNDSGRYTERVVEL